LYGVAASGTSEESTELSAAGRLGESLFLMPDNWLKGHIACMSVRLALQFNAVTADARRREREQVESHMRVCIMVHKGFESAVTVSPSEPLLAEAARHAMARGSFDLPASLAQELQTPGIAKGYRGELAALVILILAIDAAIKNHDPPPQPAKILNNSPKWKISVRSIDSFLGCLIANTAYTRIQGAKPTKARTEQEATRDFKTTFKNSKVYFNHFVKLDDLDLLSRDDLYKLIARGAAILCADGQGGVDIIVPFLFRNHFLNAMDVSAIFIQVKNAKKYTTKPDPLLFDLMDPFKLGFFKKSDKKVVPIIRMVFALGSPNAAVEIVLPKVPGLQREAKATAQRGISEEPQRPNFTSFDIWCAGASNATFEVIGREQSEIYKKLLSTGTLYQDAYTRDVNGIEARSNLRRQMNPGSALGDDHWRFATPR
jgi:hypothetical protein